MMKLPVTPCPQLRLFSSYYVPHLAKNFDVVLLICSLAWRSVLVLDNSFMIKKTVNMVLTLVRLCRTFFECGHSGDFHWEDCVFVSQSCPQTHDSSPVITCLRKSGSLLEVSSKSCATSARNSFCSCDRSCRTNFATTRFMPSSSVKISETTVHGITRSSSNSRTVNRQFLLIAAYMCSIFLGVLHVAGLPEHGVLSLDSQPSLNIQYHTFIWASLTESSTKAFLILTIVSTNESPSLKQNLMQTHLSTCSIIVNMTVIQYTSSLNGVSLLTE